MGEGLPAAGVTGRREAHVGAGARERHFGAHFPPAGRILSRHRGAPRDAHGARTTSAHCAPRYTQRAVEHPHGEEIAACLRRWSGWERVPDATIDKLAAFSELSSIKRKRSIFRRGEPGPGLFLVRSGEFKLSLISSEGREQILYLAEPGKLIGEGFLPRDVTCAASAFAMDDSEVWQFETDKVVRLISHCEELAFALMRMMAHRNNRLIDLIMDLSLRSVERRLASFMFALAVRNAGEMGRPIVLQRQLDMNTVAARLGTVREEISRALNRMQRDGMISLTRHEIVVLDLNALEQSTYD